MYVIEAPRGDLLTLLDEDGETVQTRVSGIAFETYEGADTAISEDRVIIHGGGRRLFISRDDGHADHMIFIEARTTR